MNPNVWKDFFYSDFKKTNRTRDILPDDCTRGRIVAVRENWPFLYDPVNRSMAAGTLARIEEIQLTTAWVRFLDPKIANKTMSFHFTHLFPIDDEELIALAIISEKYVVDTGDVDNHE